MFVKHRSLLKFVDQFISFSFSQHQQIDNVDGIHSNQQHDHRWFFKNLNIIHFDREIHFVLGLIVWLERRFSNGLSVSSFV